jgi:hypothetical protein
VTLPAGRQIGKEEDVTNQPHTPPMRASNEAEPEQLEIARAQGSTYGRALQAMDEESGAVTQRAGDYLAAFVQEHAEGMYDLQDGELVWREVPEEANVHQAHRQPGQSYARYLTSAHFVEATAENWESEFLQMASYVVLTAVLIQRGSPESKDPDEQEAVDEDPRLASGRRNAPGPVRRGGLALALYQHSLSLVLAGLFLISFLLHALGGHYEYNQQQIEHSEAPVSLCGFMTSAQFWFQSFQNWQSEFLAVFVLAVLGIFLRQRGSPESKPVAAPHAKTGSS